MRGGGPRPAAGTAGTSILSTLRAHPTTFMPCCTSALATAAPMPTEAPVTSATRPDQRSMAPARPRHSRRRRRAQSAARPPAPPQGHAQDTPLAHGDTPTGTRPQGHALRARGLRGSAPGGSGVWGSRSPAWKAMGGVSGAGSTGGMSGAGSSSQAGFGEG